MVDRAGRPAEPTAGTDDSGFKAELTELLPRLWRYAYALARDRERSTELVLATCERALSQQHQVAADTNVRAWCIAILQSIWRNQPRREGTPVDDPEGQGQSSTGRTQPLGQLLQLLYQLPEAQRTPMHLVYVDGLTYQEAADVLRISVATLTSRLVRARRSLAAKVDTGPSGRHRRRSNH